MHLGQEQEFSLTVPEPFSFALTVAKPAGWPWSTPREIFEEGTLWTTIRTGRLPAGLVMNARKNRIHVRVFTTTQPDKGEIGELKEIIIAGLGADEDLTGFYRFAKNDPVLKIATDDHKGMRIGLLDDVFGGVILAILLQMAPIERSERMMDAVLDLAGTPVSFDDREVVLWPLPEEIARLGPDPLRKKAIIGYRADRLVKAAEYLEKNPISLRDLAKIPEEEAMKILNAVPGIGPYSAAIIFGQSTPPIDAWSVVVMSELYDGRTPVHSRKEIGDVQARLVARWGRWSWLAFAYILNDIDNLAKIYPLSRIR